jgi:hypothetical protein
MTAPVAQQEDPLKTTFEKLASWSDSTVEQIQYCSGTATCRKTFPVSGLKSPASRVFVDLGNAKNLAEVTLNGKPLGILWTEPCRVHVPDALVEGKSELVIQAANLGLIASSSPKSSPRKTAPLGPAPVLSKQQTHCCPPLCSARLPCAPRSVSKSSNLNHEKNLNPTRPCPSTLQRSPRR